jgi:3-oxoacyl-[acyl-carrier-protein] synthase-3
MKSLISDISYYLPENILTNDELISSFSSSWTSEKILDKTGILERRISSKDETSSDLAYEAALCLFKKKNISPDDIDYLIFCSQTHDYILPSTSCILQNRLNLRNDIGAIDISLGCSGFIYSLSLSKSLIESGQVKNVLILTADTYSKFIHPRDKSVRTIFGDGAAATFVDSVDSKSEFISKACLGTDGSGYKNLIVEDWLFRSPKSENSSIEIEDEFGNIRTRDSLFMNGSEIMAFSLNQIPKSVIKTLRDLNLNKEDIDFFVFHQANKFILEQLIKKLQIPSKKVPISLKYIGNTVSSSIPIALSLLIDQKKIQKGNKVMIVGFGVGYSWGCCVLSF